jgi:hypothetical protein
VCALLFWVIDSLAQRHEPRLAALVIFYAVYSLANLSLFTTFLSGGLGLLMVLLYLLPPQPAAPLKESALAANRGTRRAPRGGALAIPG